MATQLYIQFVKLENRSLRLTVCIAKHIEKGLLILIVVVQRFLHYYIMF